MKFILKSDKYKKARGGTSKLLDLDCANCGSHLFYYQKDGPGSLKRLYLDRIFEHNASEKLTCLKCKELLGLKYIYEKENRPAYKLIPGKISKKISK